MGDLKMPEVNKAEVAGRIVRDLELRYTAGGMAVADIDLAVNTTIFHKDKDNEEEVLYLKLTVWGKTAEFCAEYLGKGSPVFAEGKLRSEQWETKDGQKRSSIKMNVFKIQPLEWKGKRKDEDHEPPESTQDRASKKEGDDDDDIPF